MPRNSLLLPCASRKCSTSTGPVFEAKSAVSTHPYQEAVGQIDFDVNIGQCVVADRNLLGSVLIKRKTLFDGEVNVLACMEMNICNT